jgi:hypothetical protein
LPDTVSVTSTSSCSYFGVGFDFNTAQNYQVCPQ